MYQNPNYRPSTPQRRAYLIGDAVPHTTVGLGFDPATAYAVVKTGSRLVSSIFGGGSEDARRQARANYMADAASRGSVLAARIVLAAPDNVGSNEARQWIGVRSRIPEDVLSRARAQGPFWPTGAPFEMPDQVAAIERELSAIGQPSSPIVGGAAPFTPPTGPTLFPDAGGTFPTAPSWPAGAQSLPPMTTTAPYNYTPLLIGAGVGVALLALMNGGNGRRR